MKIGIAGPLTLKLLNFDFQGKPIPTDTRSSLVSAFINFILEEGHEVVAYTTVYDIEKPLIYHDGKLTLCLARLEPHSGRDMFKSEREDLLYLIEKTKPDIINAFWSYEYAWAALDSGIPTIVSLHDHALTILKYKPDLYRLMRFLMNYIVLSKSTYLTTNSHYLQNLLTHAQQKRSVIIPNFYEQGLEKYYKPEYAKENYILSVANGFDKRKNIHNSLKAFKILRKKFPEIRYHLIGEGMENNGHAYQYAIKNGLDEGVDFKGSMPYDEVLLEMQNSKILLHPAREESFGMVILEAMLIGTPVIGGDKSGNVPFLLDNGNSGALCNINDPIDIAANTIQLLENNLLYEKIRTNAYNHARTTYSGKIVIKKLLDYYSFVLKNSKP